MQKLSLRVNSASSICRTLMIGLMVSGLSSCATVSDKQDAKEFNDDTFFTPLRAPKDISNGEQTLIEGEEEQQVSSGLQIMDAPRLTLPDTDGDTGSVFRPVLQDKPVSRLSFNNLPVPAFINEVFGNQLGINFIVEPGLQNAPDLVTMRIDNRVNAAQLYDLAVATLRNYGVTTKISDNVLRFAFAPESQRTDIPLLISGRALPEVPSNSRPIFYIYPLSAVTTPQVRGVLTQMFPRNELQIQEEMNSNSLIFIGPQNLVAQAVAAAKMVDIPSMKGSYSRVLRPSISSVSELATNLEQVLIAEGYSVRGAQGAAAVRLLPLDSVDQLVVFARSKEVLDHVIGWAKVIETERHSKVEQGLFSYQVQSTQARHVVEVLNSLGVADVAFSSGGDSDSQGSGNRRPAPARSGGGNGKGRYAVDEQLNTILFSGSGKDWLQVLPVIKSLDRPAPSVLVEVILAEVSLNDDEASGVEWLANSSLGRFDVTSTTQGGLGLGASGFNLFLDTAGQTRAALNLFYNSNRAEIRSRPRLMVKSGGEASIDVGDEIPIITSNSQSTQNTNAPVIQNISYRRTGVIMEIKPTVHASGFVDIEINQELSEATGTESSSIDSPTISNRRISTTVTLRDGGSVLLGGLIRETKADGTQGVPLLGKLPGVGKLFSTDTNESRRTELMVMIIPYVLSSPSEAEDLTEELRRARAEFLNSNF
ncbi:secretin N-terminal domain-containing protein [Aestuariibacter salexigens]|uniref:secretin N-terminal domain-containing protein n=1 Tax=Aestuariibacter salexigens TaxID=226010 RepID=UPI000A00019C|nr:secretin N-terminal domain-containing protein [Aestuariibacter salexigens]